MKTLEVLQTVALLTPWDVQGAKKLRLGHGSDGAYVVLDLLRPEQPVYSYGVGPDSSFDADLGVRGHDVFMYDHTVGAPRGSLPATCRFFREGIAPVADPAGPLGTLEDHIRRNGHLGRTDLVLKMDIEGAEWPVLGTLPEPLFGAFEQILVEIHDLHRLGEDEHRAAVRTALTRLANRFTLFHVHANVYGGLALAEGVPVARVLELSYVRSDLVSREPSRTLYPTEFDRTNRPGHKDILLTFFPFVPNNRPPLTQFAEAALRLDSQHGA